MAGRSSNAVLVQYFKTVARGVMLTSMTVNSLVNSRENLKNIKKIKLNGASTL